MRPRLALLLPSAVLGLVLAAPSGLAKSGSAPPRAADETPWAMALDAWAKPLVDRGHLSGQLLVTRHGRVILERSYGYANLELGVRVTPETRFNVASITKPMTMLLAFRLMEKKAIGYTDSIAKWLPDFPHGERITIEHLLRHRSGIPHEIVPDSEAVRPRTAAEMVERARTRPLDFEPGTKSAYSSGGFTVLARILEIASGKDYETLLEEDLFRPLGMAHSLHTDSERLLPGRAACYVPGLGGIENAPFQDLSGLVGAGSVWSTARDIDRFVQATVSGRLGDEFRRSWVRGGKLDWNGQTSGFRAYATWDSASGLGIVFAGNVASGAPPLLKEAVQRLAAGERPPSIELPTLANAPLAPERVAAIEGVYRLENGTRLDLHVRGDQLLCGDWPLFPTTEGTLFSPRDYGLVRPVAGPDGRVARLDWTQNGVVYPAPRIADAK